MDLAVIITLAGVAAALVVLLLMATGHQPADGWLGNLREAWRSVREQGGDPTLRAELVAAARPFESDTDAGQDVEDIFAIGTPVRGNGYLSTDELLRRVS